MTGNEIVLRARQALCVAVVLLDAWVFGSLTYTLFGPIKAAVAFAAFGGFGVWIAFRPATTSQKIAHEVLLQIALIFLSFTCLSSTVADEIVAAGGAPPASQWRAFLWLVASAPIDLRAQFIVILAVARLFAWVVEEMAHAKSE